MNSLRIQTSFLFALFSAACALPKTSEKAERTFNLMGTTLNVVVYASTRDEALKLSEQVFKTIKTNENRLSTWNSQSELSLVNRAPLNQELKLSPLLNRDLKLARYYAKQTDFTFNPFIGPIVDIWALRTKGRIPTSSEIQEALYASSSYAFEFTSDGIIKRKAKARIEEGGFGKGFALDDAVHELKLSGAKHAVLNFGGQITIVGTNETPVEIASPTERSTTLVRFSANEGSIATSGNSEHGLHIKSGRKNIKIGHLLNPHTGKPADYEGSITVYAQTSSEADAYTKIFVLGLEAGMEWANTHQVKVLWIVPSKQQGEWVVHTSLAWSAPLTLASTCHNSITQTKEKP